MNVLYAKHSLDRPGRPSTRTVVVSTRLVQFRRPSLASSPPHGPRSSASTSSRPSNSSRSTSSPSSSPPRRRKSGSAAVPVGPSPREVKRLKADKLRECGPKPVPRASSHDQAAAPEPIYRSSKSLCTPHSTLTDEGETQTPVVGRCWVTEEDGVADSAHLSSEQVVMVFLHTYCAYFENLEDPTDCSFQPHPTNYPYVALEYPNTHSSERFILLAPKDKDHYNPIMDVERTLCTIIEHYLTPAQQALFGSMPRDTLLYWDDRDAPSPDPSLTPPGSHWSSENLLRAVQRAIHRRDGPSFLAAFEKINELMRILKCPKLPAGLCQKFVRNALKNMVNSWTYTGLPKKVLMRIIEENYQRSVGPHVQKLKQYEAFSNAVYGELMPSLIYEIIQLTKLTEDSLFLDLGSGVGNVVVQASLQTGCRSYGIELNPNPARIARDMVANCKARCRMWGVKMGNVELEEGDMLRSSRVDELIRQADVVLVDNKAFEQSFNEQLRPKFLDLKEGAYVVSLAPFLPSWNARVTERNVNDVSAIFDVTERLYYSGSVSWGNSGGTYYIHRVNRAGYARIRERFENSRTGSRPGCGAAPSRRPRR